jgi:hypothetical protein
MAGVVKWNERAISASLSFFDEGYFAQRWISSKRGLALRRVRLAFKQASLSLLCWVETLPPLGRSCLACLERER